MPDEYLGAGVGLDTTAFKTGVTELKAQVNQIENSFRASAAVMGNWSKSTEGLSSRTASLEEKLKLQKQALSTLNEEYRKTSAEQGSSSKAAQSLANQMFDMEKKISGTEGQLKKYESQLKSVKSQEAENNSSMAKIKSNFASVAEVSKTASDKMKSHFSGIKSALSGLGGVMAGFVATAGATFTLKSFIDSATAAEQTTAQMNAVLTSTKGVAGMTAKQLTDLAAAQAKVTTFSAGTTKQAENMLLTFTNIHSEVFPQTIKASQDMATAMKMDLTDAAKTLGKAMNDPTAGLSKLTKQGVTFTDAQKEQVKAMQKAGDTAGAQKVILQELEKEFGGSAVAAGSTFSGQMQIAQNTLKGVGSTIGTALLPAIKQILPQLVSWGQKIAETITSHKGDIQNAVTAISGAVSKTITFFEQHGKQVIETIGGIAAAMAIIRGAFTAFNTVSAITNTIQTVNQARAILATGATFAQAAAATTATGAQIGLNAAMLAGALPIIGIVAAVAAVVAAFIYLWNNCEEFRNFWINLWNGIKSTAQAVGNWFKGPFVDFFKGTWNGITGFFSGLPGWFSNLWNSVMNGWNTLKNGIGNVMSAVQTGLTTAWNAIVGVVIAIVQPFVNGILDFWRAIQPGLSSIMDGVRNIFAGAWKIIKNVVLGPVLLICDLVTGNFSALGSDLAHLWENIRNGAMQVWTGLQQYFSGILSGIVGIFATAWNHITANVQAAWNAVVSFIISVFNTLRTVIVNAWNGYWNTIFSILNTMRAGILNVWDSVLNWFRNLPGTLWTIGSNMFTAMRNGVNSTVHTVVTAVKSGIGSAVEWIKNLPSEAFQWGKDIIDGIVDGIKRAASAVRDAVNGVAQNIRSFLHFSVPDEGPLTDYESWMPDFMNGLARGIEKSKYKVRNAIQALSTDISVGVSPHSGGPVPAFAGVGGNSTVNNYSISQTIQGAKDTSPAENYRQLRDFTRQLNLKKG